MAAARWSVQPASSGRALSPWSVRPGHLPWHRSPVRVQHAVSTHPVPPSGVRRSGRPVSGRLVSSVSSVPARLVSGRLVSGRPVSTRPVSTRPVGQPAAVRPRPSGRVRLIPPRAVAVWTRSVRRATCTTGTGRCPGGRHAWSGSVDGRAGPNAGDAAGVARWSVGVGGGPGPGWVRAAAALDRWGTRQGWPACGALSLTAALWAREQAAARGGRSGRVAAALGLGWGRPR
jgi:hypothetical protein